MTSTATHQHLLTMQEAADRLGVSARFIRHAVRQGSIGSVRVGRLVRLRPEHIERYIESRSSEPATSVLTDHVEGR